MQRRDISPAVECRRLEKSFSGVPVLRGISLRVEPASVLGIAGENGAGKSTLMNIIGGVIRADSGEMELSGADYRPASPIDASRRGVAFVHQELDLFPNLSIADNLFLGEYPRLGWLIDRGRMHAEAARLLGLVGLNIDPQTPADRLSQGERQLVEIARALGANARLIILDEPTTSLVRDDVERLFKLMRDLQQRGIAMIYISHALDDLLGVSDDILVLRDGESVAEGPASEFSKDRLITAMVGRSIDQLFPPKKNRASEAPLLEARSISQPGILHNVSLSLSAGEIVGLAGLMGSGRSELARILFGLDPHASGQIVLGGERIDRLSTRDRIKRGMAFVTESRRDDGLFIEQPIDPNLSIVSPRSGALDALVKSLKVRFSNRQEQPVKQLSGGNQQKIALGKWLVSTPRVLILDEPTRGIDVGAKLEIYRIIQDLAQQGVAVLMISSEMEELIGTCDRIAVMRKGELQSSFEMTRFDREEILRAAL